MKWVERRIFLVGCCLLRNFVNTNALSASNNETRILLSFKWAGAGGATAVAGWGLLGGLCATARRCQDGPWLWFGGRSVAVCWEWRLKLQIQRQWADSAPDSSAWKKARQTIVVWPHEVVAAVLQLVMVSAHLDHSGAQMKWTDLWHNGPRAFAWILYRQNVQKVCVKSCETYQEILENAEKHIMKHTTKRCNLHIFLVFDEPQSSLITKTPRFFFPRARNVVFYDVSWCVSLRVSLRFYNVSWCFTTFRGFRNVSECFVVSFSASSVPCQGLDHRPCKVWRLLYPLILVCGKSKMFCTRVSWNHLGKISWEHSCLPYCIVRWFDWFFGNIHTQVNRWWNFLRLFLSSTSNCLFPQGFPPLTTPVWDVGPCSEH